MSRGCDAWVKAMTTKVTAKKRATAQKKQQKKNGRPSKYTPELVAEICERLSKGEPLAAICRDVGVAHNTVWEWRERDKELSEAIARAREIGEDAIAENLREVARGGAGSTGDVQRDKLVIDTDLKLLAKWNPKKWGDKLQHADADGGKIETPTFILAPVRSVEGG